MHPCLEPPPSKFLVSRSIPSRRSCCHATCWPCNDLIFSGNYPGENIFHLCFRPTPLYASDLDGCAEAEFLRGVERRLSGHRVLHAQAREITHRDLTGLGVRSHTVISLSDSRPFFFPATISPNSA